MTDKYKINCLQLCSLMVLISLSGFVGSGFYCLIKRVAIDGYLSIIMGGLIGIMFALLLTYIAGYQADLPINEKINKLFGKTLGFIINIIVVLVVLVIGIVFIYNMTNFISSQFLSETPISFIAIIFALLTLYVTNKGIEAFSRASLLILIINFILYMVAIFGLVPSLELDNFLPFLKDGISRPLMGVFYFVCCNIIPMFLLLMIPKDNIVDKNKYNKFIILSTTLVIILMGFIFLVVIGNLGIYLTSSYQYPEYIVLKRISLFNFLDRIENIIVIQWVLGLCLSICIVVYYIANSFRKNSQSKRLNGLITLVLFGISLFAFKNDTVFNNFVYYYFPYIIIIILVVMLLCGIAIWRKKRKTT